MKLPRINNLTELAQLIRNIDDSDTSEAGFDMNAPWLGFATKHPCGTAACIGGWLHETNAAELAEENFEDLLQEIHLGLELYEAETLCYRYPRGVEITQEQAARAIEILRDTGECDWDRAMEEGEAV